jgi:FkbM family methyltransferase
MLKQILGNLKNIFDKGSRRPKLVEGVKKKSKVPKYLDDIAELDPYQVSLEIIPDDDPIIFDIGAYVGKMSHRYRELYPRATIHSFEPFPDSFEVLAKGFKDDGNQFSHQQAISNFTGDTILNSNKSAATNSLLPTDARGSKYWGKGLLNTDSTIKVSATSIDQFCEDKKSRR